MPPTNEDPKKEEGNLPDPVMDVLKDLQTKVADLNKPKDEEPKATTVPNWQQEREAERKALGFTEEQMQAHERTIARAQAPVIERTAWSALEKRQDLDKYRKEIEAEVAIYPQERRTPEILEKIYFMVKGRHADSAPAPKVEEKKPADRVASSRVSGGPGYSGTEGGSSAEKETPDKSEELDDMERMTAKKLGVDEKRFALSRNSGRDITPFKKEAPAATSGADLELKRLQGARR